VTLDTGIVIHDCPIFPDSVARAPWHDRHFCAGILNAAVQRAHDACVPSVIPEESWTAMCSSLVICLVGHPFEWQDRPDEEGTPLCLADLAEDVTVLKLGTCDRYGHPTDVWQEFTRRLILQCHVIASQPHVGKGGKLLPPGPAITAETPNAVELLRTGVETDLRDDVRAIQDDQDAQQAQREWCYGMIHNQTVVDWLAANPTPDGWDGLVVQDGPPGGPYVAVPMGWAYTNRDTIFPPLGG
jgi:hypothetical protein